MEFLHHNNKTGARTPIEKQSLSMIKMNLKHDNNF
jgi:hypothetical protein